MALEYIWCFIAAALAGIGTGLAGLSAATVMVPILIVLCPSFSGETGAYQATAVSIDDIVVRKWRKQNGVHNRNLFTGH